MQALNAIKLGSHNRAAKGTPRRASRRKLLSTLAVAAASVTVFGIVAAMLLNQSVPDQHKRIPQITVLRLPPPPPKPEEKPPEPPKVKEEVHIDTPRPVEQPQPADQPPQGPLGVDAQGTGPGDSFGLAGRPGGRDITTIGGGGGSGLSQSVFGNAAARFLAQELARNPKLKNSTYQVELLIWIGRDGRLEREQIVKGSGNPDIDRLIRSGLSEVAPYRQPVPEGLPQPLRIRVTSSDV